jgi:hypothetical protein
MRHAGSSGVRYEQLAATARIGLEMPAGYVEFLARYPTSVKELCFDFGTRGEYLCHTACAIAADQLITVSRDFRARLQINDQGSTADYRPTTAFSKTNHSRNTNHT